MIPVDGQLPEAGASIGTNFPSRRDPLRLKYQLIAPSLLLVQVNAGVTPAPALRAALRLARV